MAVPVIRGKMYVLVDKGRPWSVVEHLLLEALSRKEWKAAELALAAGMPRRVVVEAIIRLMRAGWVEISRLEGAVSFKANAYGLAAASESNLPSTPRRVRRPIAYVVDLIVGDIYRSRELSVISESLVRDKSAKERLVWISPHSNSPKFDPVQFISRLLDEDEKFVDAEPSGFSRKYLLVTVRDGVIAGLPTRNLAGLRTAIIDAAQSAAPEGKTEPQIFSIPEASYQTNEETPVRREILFNLSDLILDGAAHEHFLRSTFKRAATQVFIHSTFIDEQRFLALLPDMAAAVKRGVRIHVFWGQNEDRKFIGSTQLAIAKLRKNSDVIGLDGRLTIYPFSTSSHAKLLVADSGKDRGYVAVVGSCNWFTSDFKSYEASVALRDPRVVRAVIEYLAKLSCTHNGVWSDLASELVNLSDSLSDLPYGSPGNAFASIVLGAHHERFVLRARDEAKRRVFVASHRLGAASISSVIAPAIAAVKDRKINVDLFYNRSAGAIHSGAAEALVESAALSGVSVKPIQSPRLHAKVLAWDDDSVVITSLNWLSGDPVDMQSTKEIGVWIEGKNVAKALIDNFVAAKSGVQDG